MANNTVAYGFTELKDLFANRIVTISAQTLQTAISDSLQEYTEQVSAMMGTMVEPTLEFKRRYQLASGGSLQPIDEKGNPRPVVLSGSYDVAFPIQMGGWSWGNDRVSRAKMTIGDANRYTMEAMRMDADWMIRHILAALFTNATFTFTDPAYGSLTIQTLANNDSVTYVLANGVPTTDNHFFFQAAGIADATDPYSVLYTALGHHPGNQGPFIAYIASNLVATTQALAAFAEVRDPDVIYSVTNPVLGPSAVNPNSNQYDQGDMLYFGDRILGKVDNMWVVEWSRLPSGYIIGHASGTNDVLGMRQEPEPELQGLRPEFYTPDGNLNEYRVFRRCGFGAINRTAAAVMQVGAGSYTIPTAFTAPLVS